MTRRIGSFLLIVWLLGFIGFAATLPVPAKDTVTDGVIVFTGDAGRIQHGLKLLTTKKAREMLVSGVHRDVRPSEFRKLYDVPDKLMACCVTLGFDAFDTRSNARESTQWLREKNIRSVRIVTTDWHMRRAMMELKRTIPKNITLVPDATVSQPSLSTFFLEYNKLLARKLEMLWQ